MTLQASIAPRTTRSSSRKRDISAFCRFIYRNHKSLYSLTTEELASAYRSFYKLPNVLRLGDIKMHCRLIGISDVLMESLPKILTAYNLEKKGKTEFCLNLNHWPGIYGLAIFHEIYELIEGRFAQLYEGHRPLRGKTLERRANKFGSCVIVSSLDAVDIPRLIASVPALVLLLGDQALGALYNRIRFVMDGHYPFLFVRYVRNLQDDGRTDFVASRVIMDRSKCFLPRAPRKILLSLLPAPGESYQHSRIPMEAYDFQGPILLSRDKGFDIFGRHDLSIICIPSFTDGEVSEISLFGVKSSLFPLVLEVFRNLDPKIIKEMYQVL